MFALISCGVSKKSISKKKTISLDENLTEESDNKLTDTVEESFLENEGGTVNKYAQAISRQLKK